MKQIKFYGVLFVLLMSFASCNNDDDDGCEGEDPGPNEAFFGVFNQDGVSLIGVGNTYDPSEIILSNSSLDFPLSQVTFFNSDDIFMRFSYDSMETGIDYLLMLNSTEVDVINLVFSFQETDCFTIKRIEEFKINDMVIVATDPGEHEFRIVK